MALGRAEKYKEGKRDKMYKKFLEDLHLSRKHRLQDIVACQAPICFDLEVARLFSGVFCRNVQTQGTKRDTAHMKVSDCRPFIVLYLFFPIQNNPEATLAFSAV